MVVPVHPLRRPAIGGEAPQHVLGEGERGIAVDRDVVVVPEDGQLLELHVAGQRGGLVADALLQVAVRGDHPGAVIHQALAEARRQVPLGDRHADRRGDALAERARGGLDPRMLAELGMAGGGGVQLAEAPELLDPHARMPGQVQQGVEQHRAVPSAEHEAVAVRPARIGGVVFQELREQHRGDIRHAHRHAGMARLRRLDRIDGQRADGVGHAPLLARGVAGEEGGLRRLGGGRAGRPRVGFDGGQEWASCEAAPY